MGNGSKGSFGASCPAICWLVSILLGLLVVAILVTWANWPMTIVLVLGLIATVAAGWVLPSYFCQPQEGESGFMTVSPEVAEEHGGAVPGEADEDEGVKPVTLSAARGDKADDLKMIKGIGPKMEIMCNEMGFYHFDQIAAWSADEVSWVDENLEGFKGRVTRDDWVGQARLLAAGGETDFSKRVEDGGVY